MTCAPNKTVQCGTAWNFDAPTATVASCVCTNVVVTVLNTLAYQPNPCTSVITRTWLATDCCTNTNTCSQTVTEVDTTPPTILGCPYPVLIEQLNPCQQLVIPLIKLRATDNCTPASQLVWSQSPPAGTIVTGSDHVIVTVTDLCGNSSQCDVLVLGQRSQTGGLVVTCPASMTVTNCLVPLVLVTVTDPCCTSPNIMINQSPSSGTCVVGIKSITVTVTDRCGNSVTKVVTLNVTGTDSFLGNLYNTGTGAGQNPGLLPPGSVDLHYTLDSVPQGTVTGVNNYNPFQAIVSDFNIWPLPPAPPANRGSDWISLDANSFNFFGGDYTYSLPFSLPANLDPNTASIYGRWAADGTATMTINNIPVLGGLPPSNNTWENFTIPAASGITANNNTIRFVVNQNTFFTGLRVEFYNAFANCCTCSPPVMQNSVGQSWPLGSTATFSVNPGGTPPFSYQWYFGSTLLAGATASILQVHPVLFSSAGLYSVVISNNCGAVTDYFQLHVTQPSQWPNGLWNVAVVTNPLAATIGPDLALVGTSYTSNYSITAGTTEDFGLPELGGQIVNVMDINPNAAPSIQIPLIAAPGSNTDNSYTVIMDIYEPDTSLGTPSTLFQSIACCISNLGSSGQDGVAMTLDASNNLHLTGSATGVPFDTGPATNLSVDCWNRVAMVVDDPQDGVAINLGLYLNGQQVASLNVPTPVGLPINWSNGPPTLFSVQTNSGSTNGEFDVASIQFYAAGLSPQGIASMGSPANGPAPTLETPTGGTENPVLTATITNGLGYLSWCGSPYVLQESTDLSTGVWTTSVLPFTETGGTNGDVTTGAILHPYVWGPSKFYRLVINPQATSDGSAQAP
jgi:hypothetical protein